MVDRPPPGDRPAEALPDLAQARGQGFVTVETVARGSEPDERARQAVAGEESAHDRLLRRGAGALTDTELLAVLFCSGSSPEAALELARTLDARLGGLVGLTQASLDTLRAVGLTERRAAPVLAAVEIARRLTRGELPPRRPLDEPAKLARYLAVRYGSTSQEVVGGVFLDTRHRILSDQAFFRGTLRRAAVEPRSILKVALLLHAAGLVLFHVHPSDDPGPSLEDDLFTRRMGRACDLLGVRLVDHMIVTPSARWTLMSRRGPGGRR